MNNKIYTFEEIRSIINDYPDMRYVSIEDQSKTRKLPFNKKDIPILKQLDKLEGLIKKVYAPGNYYIVMRSNHAKTRAEERYLIQHGEIVAGTDEVVEKATEFTHEDKTIPGMTTEEIIEFRVKQASLELHNQTLSEENERLLLQVEELEEELKEREEEITTLGDASKPLETAGKMLSDAFENATPMIDRILNQKERKLRMQEAQMEHQFQQYYGQPGQPRQPQGLPSNGQQPQQPQQQEGVTYDYPVPPELNPDWNFEFLVAMYAEKPEEYEYWLQVMAHEDPDIYTEYSGWVAQLNAENSKGEEEDV